MKVKELIEFLKVQPQDVKVVVFAIDTDSGYDEADNPMLIDVVHKPESHGPVYFEAETEEVREHKTIKVVRIW